MVKSKKQYFKEIGKIGELIAQRYLISNDYNIRHTNWHHGHKELDIVAVKDNVLVIVEVKTRKTDYWEEPKEAVRRKKQRMMIDAADAYVINFNLDMDVQFDIISIVLQNGQHQLEHIKDAFQPTF